MQPDLREWQAVVARCILPLIGTLAIRLDWTAPYAIRVIQKRQLFITPGELREDSPGTSFTVLHSVFGMVVAAGFLSARVTL